MHARRILVLGATSAIAQAYARRRAAEGATLLVAGRNNERLRSIVADLLICGAAGAEHFVCDFVELSDIDRLAQTLWSRFPDPDEVLISYGDLGEHLVAEQDLTAAHKLLDTNFTSAVLWILALLKHWLPHKPLTLVVIGSVAGDRGRATNYVYGSAKGGLDRFLEGLAHKHNGTALSVVTVKPGFVDTPMTTKIRKRGLLWATADQVACDICSAIAKRKRIVYTPRYWRPIMIAICAMPWFLFKRLRV